MIYLSLVCVLHGMCAVWCGVCVVCVYAVCMHMHMPWYTHAGQRKTCLNWSSSCIMWAPDWTEVVRRVRLSHKVENSSGSGCLCCVEQNPTTGQSQNVKPLEKGNMFQVVCRRIISCVTDYYFIFVFDWDCVWLFKIWGKKTGMLCYQVGKEWTCEG